ncbi:uncharacterized protein EMH_0014950 [Eimeria mitis]|uniref:Uncharacterized protein n=1 Tax=Eimeria mitis TaxID=44415 RepID=U6KCD8_9EIME|nr:uncharacterized protein EMH_0014950 [Eimeria mitis]CDJ33158.1 hypothetical protein, conserved [Eimeria mitis]
MCIKGRGGYPHAGRRLAEDSDSDSVFAATCEAWLDDDSESEPSEEEPDTSPGTASSSISLESPQGKVESPEQAKHRELGTALKYLSRVEFPDEGASQDVVVEQEYTGANEQAWMRVVRTVDPTTDPWSNVLPAGVFLPSQLWETEEAEPGPSAKDETSKSDVPETSPQPSTSGAGVSSQSDAPEKRERPVPQSIRRPTASQTSTAAPLLLSRVNNDTHPFFRLPSADTSGYRVHFNPDTSALSREGARIVHPLLIEVRRKLIKQALTKEDLVELAGLAEKLMANLLFFHEYELPSAPSRLVEALGKRFLALDALVSVLEVLGVERQGPSSNLTVSIKRRLFCSRNTDRYYRRPWFNPWRQDDREFLISQEQQQQKKE